MAALSPVGSPTLQRPTRPVPPIPSAPSVPAAAAVAQETLSKSRPPSPPSHSTSMQDLAAIATAGGPTTEGTLTAAAAVLSISPQRASRLAFLPPPPPAPIDEKTPPAPPAATPAASPATIHQLSTGSAFSTAQEVPTTVATPTQPPVVFTLNGLIERGALEEGDIAIIRQITTSLSANIDTQKVQAAIAEAKNGLLQQLPFFKKEIEDCFKQLPRLLKELPAALNNKDLNLIDFFSDKMPGLKPQLGLLQAMLPQLIQGDAGRIKTFITQLTPPAGVPALASLLSEPKTPLPLGGPITTTVADKKKSCWTQFLNFLRWLFCLPRK